ncbi:MAG TPA: aldo/keto reductase [Alphaproteobacteria bacterium]|nr:aldo/keto reductase [Alphaproteobacteria bacterium]
MAPSVTRDILAHGAKIPKIGLGTWQLTGRSCREAVSAALGLGYRHIDTAQMYGNESEVGDGIRDAKLERASLFVTTKLDLGSMTRARVGPSAEESLRKLKLDYVDLLLIHWPSKSVPMGETLAAMEALKARGLVKHIGVSNFTVALMREAVETHKAEPVCNQIEYHPWLGQAKVLAAARGHGMAVAAYCPLGRGEAPGDRTLSAIGKRHGKSAAQVALRWLIEQDGVAAIPKSSSREHIAANLDVFDFALTDEDRAEIARLPKDQRIVNWGASPVWDR